MAEPIKPTEVSILCQDGEERPYIFSKFPYTVGREIMAAYPTANIPKLGDYQSSEAAMLRLMQYVGVPDKGPNGGPLWLKTKALVDNHIPDWEAGLRVEFGMIEYNCSFFGQGKTSDFFANFAAKVTPWIISTLTALRDASSQPVKPPSKS